jgi:CRP-like cAMP-binding protein
MQTARVYAPFNKMDDAGWKGVCGAGEIRSLRTGKSFWYQGDKAEYCIIIISGSVRTQMYRSDESSLDLGIFKAGDWIGIAELLLKGPYMTDCTAAESCEVMAFSRFGMDLLLRIPMIQRWFLDEMARRQYALFSRVELMRPIDRLTRYLAEMADNDAAIIKCTQEDVAEAIGTTRETVNRNMRKLQDDGIVCIGRGHVEIIDLEKLKEYNK